MNDYEKALMAAYNRHAKSHNQLPALDISHVPGWYNDAFSAGMIYGSKSCEIQKNRSYSDTLSPNKGFSGAETTRILQSDHFRESAGKARKERKKGLISIIGISALILIGNRIFNHVSAWGGIVMIIASFLLAIYLVHNTFKEENEN